MPRIVREHPVLSVFSLGYVLAFTGFGVATSRGQTGTYLLQLSVTFAFVAAVHERVGFSGPVLWALAVWGLLHAAGGILYVGEGVLYRFKPVPGLPRFDQAVHAFGFGVATVAVWQGLQTRLPRGAGLGAGIGFVVALAGMGVGALNEVLEFLSTRVLAETNVGGYVNTGWDLVYNAIGATAAAAWIAVRERRRGTTVSASAPVDDQHGDRRDSLDMATIDPTDRPIRTARTRFRCASCGNLTRFDVYETRRTRAYHHFTLGGDLNIDEEEVLEAERDRVTCRWCGSSDAIEELPADEELPVDAASEEQRPKP